MKYINCCILDCGSTLTERLQIKFLLLPALLILTSLFIPAIVKADPVQVTVTIMRVMEVTSAN